MRIGDAVNSFSVSATSINVDWVTVLEFSNYQGHNEDGKGYCFLEAYCNAPSGTSLAGQSVTGKDTVTLDIIPRYANITSLIIKSKTINTITLNYTIDRTASIYCSLNGGATWLNGGNPFVEDTTGGTLTIQYKDRNNTEMLDPNTEYTITILARAKISDLDQISSIKTTTYQIATLSNVPNVNIGSSHTVTWSNPSGASLKLALYKTDGKTLIQDIGTVTGTSKIITPTASNIYPLVPNSKTITLRYILTTTQNNKSYTSYKDCVFTVTNSNPTFNDFEYEDTNETTTALTGNNKILISGYSNVKATISVDNKAIATNNATMKDYILAVGNLTDTQIYSSTENVSMEVFKVNNATITVSANDSRGFSTPVTQIAETKDYSKPVITQMLATRSDNGVGELVTLQFEGNWWNKNFGAVNNAIENIKYYYKKSTSTEEWIEGTKQITFSVEEDRFSGNLIIEGDTSAKGFDASSSYFIMLIVNDKLDASKEYQTTLGSGTPAIAIYKDNVAIGQKYDTDIGGKLQVNGDTNIDGELQTNGDTNIDGKLQVNGDTNVDGNLKENGKRVATLESINKLLYETSLSSNTSTGINITGLLITEDFEILLDIPSNSSNSNISISFNNITTGYLYVRNFSITDKTSGSIPANGDCNITGNGSSIPITVRANSHSFYDISVSLTNILKLAWIGGSISTSQGIAQNGYAYNSNVGNVRSFKVEGFLPSGTTIKIYQKK